MENKGKIKGKAPSKPGRRPGTVMINRHDIVKAALAQLNREAKQELVLRNIKPKDRTTENGLKPSCFVKFTLSKKEMEKRYPDHSLDEVYRVARVLYAFETSNGKEAVHVYNMSNEAMGYVEADCLKLSEELEMLA